MSQSSEVTLRLAHDLHARPAGQLVQTVARFDATVTVAFGDHAVDASGVLAIMGLGATAGSEITLRAAGADADEVLTAVIVRFGELGVVETEPSR
jgi:PTS hybrid protein